MTESRAPTFCSTPLPMLRSKRRLTTDKAEALPAPANNMVAPISEFDPALAHRAGAILVVFTTDKISKGLRLLVRSRPFAAVMPAGDVHLTTDKTDETAALTKHLHGLSTFKTGHCLLCTDDSGEKIAALDWSLKLRAIVIVLVQPPCSTGAIDSLSRRHEIFLLLFVKGCQYPRRYDAVECGRSETQITPFWGVICFALDSVLEDLPYAVMTDRRRIYGCSVLIIHSFEADCAVRHGNSECKAL